MITIEGCWDSSRLCGQMVLLDLIDHTEFSSSSQGEEALVVVALEL
jgi:hypothetical protein